MSAPAASAAAIADPDRSWLAALNCDPVFDLDHARDLHVGQRWPAARAGALLAHTVARTPSSLLAHVQRVQLWIEDGNPDETYAAMLDLFVALGTRGAALRERMLAAAAPVLDQDRARYLAAALIPGLEATHPHPAAPGSMLSRGLTGSLSLVARLAEVAAPALDPVHEADNYVAEGNVPAAQAVLEAALLAAPARADLSGALLDLYRRMRDADSLRLMRARLGPSLRGAGAWSDIEREILAQRGDER